MRPAVALILIVLALAAGYVLGEKDRDLWYSRHPLIIDYSNGTCSIFAPTDNRYRTK